MIKFGDIIRYKENRYVFLAATDEVVYLAKILVEHQKEKILKSYDNVSCRGSLNQEKRKNNPLYCFVILKTEEYKGEMAHFFKPDQDNDPGFVPEVLGALICEDLIQIKEEILNENSALPRQLKDSVKELEIN